MKYEEITIACMEKRLLQFKPFPKDYNKILKREIKERKKAYTKINMLGFKEHLNKKLTGNLLTSW